jgi:RimJ/RimL family protein N-acetyltransferase
MPGPVFLRGDRVNLRTFEEADLGFLAPAYEDPAVRQRMGSHGPYVERHERNWLESLGDDTVGLVLCPRAEAAEPTGVGLLTLYDIDAREGRAEMGAVLLPGVRGEGYATEGCSLLLDYAFGVRRLHRVRATTLAVNDPARATLDRLGFELEGRTREATLVAGERVDELRYGLLASEWDRSETTD